MPQLNPEGAETKRSPALGRGLAEGGVGLKVGLPGTLSGSLALLPGRGVSSRRRRCCPHRVSHAGKWPPRSILANRCLWPDAPLPGQMLLLEHRLRPEVQSFLSLPSRTHRPASRPSGKLQRALCCRTQASRSLWRVFRGTAPTFLARWGN